MRTPSRPSPRRLSPPGCVSAPSTGTSGTSTQCSTPGSKPHATGTWSPCSRLRPTPKALVLPCGALGHEPVRSLDEDLDETAAQLIRAGQRAAEFGVELWTESLHFLRFCWNLERAEQLAQRLAGSGVGIVMDFSHIVAAGEDPLEYVELHAGRIAHVHVRDAVPGNINLSIGNGQADFATGLQALAAHGYAGHFSLELETRDVTHDEGPAAAAKAASFITDLI
jgi:sugar phosphate isomerase/epimerase